MIIIIVHIVILFLYGFLNWKDLRVSPLILPRQSPAVLTFFTGRGWAAKMFHKAGRGVLPWSTYINIVYFQGGLDGETACEGHGFDTTQCLEVGCCHWNEDQVN